MKLLDIKTYPDCILGKKADKVVAIDNEILDLIHNMTYTMNKAKGIGLAAPQVGILRRIIVYNINDNKKIYALINPQILDMDKKIVSKNEGCLSIPSFQTNINRFNRIIIEGISINGKRLKMEAEGLLSVVLQHEIDHLNGILLIDHVSSLKRSIYKKQLIKFSKLKR